MGPREDPYAVVDPQLRVYGVSGLRVVDASIMPTIPNGNINAPTIMIGEKGADLVKSYWMGLKKKRKRRDLSDQHDPEVRYNARVLDEGHMSRVVV